MLAVIDAVVHTETDQVIRTEEAIAYLTRNQGLAHFLLLINGPETLILHDDARPWTRTEAERLARQKGYGRFVVINRDGSKLEGALTGRNTYAPVARRLVAVA